LLLSTTDALVSSDPACKDYLREIGALVRKKWASQPEQKFSPDNDLRCAMQHPAKNSEYPTISVRWLLVVLLLPNFTGFRTDPTSSHLKKWITAISAIFAGK